MFHRPKAVAAAAIAALALVGGGQALAGANAGKHGKAIHRLVVKAAAQYLGLSKHDLRAQLHGKSLAQLAVAESKSVDGLEAAMLAPVKARLDKRVAAGKLTADKEQAKLARISKRIDKIVNKIRQ
jgi:hypothetical protein